MFVVRLFKMVANQYASGLNRGLTSNIWWLKKANYMNFTEECVMYTKKHILF